MHKIIVSLLVGGVLVTALAGHGSAGAACPFGIPDGGGFASPFEGSGGGGPANLFPEVNPSSDMPCPFEGGDGGGSAEVFPEVNPSSDMPCPFQRSVTSTDETGSAVTVAEPYPAPGDPDEDGLYEDLNGNGRIDFADLILYVNQMDWIRENQPLCCFDYNGNGNIDFADVIQLFHEI